MGVYQFRRVVRTGCVILSVFLLSVLAACGSDTEEEVSLFQIYFIDEDESGLVTEEYETVISKQNIVDTIQKLLGQLQTKGSAGRYKNPIEPEIEISNFLIKETQLSLYFTATYSNKSGIDEILARAAIVKTLCQVPGVDFVEFYVEDQPLKMSGNAVGLMNQDTFVDELNPEFKEQKKRVTLYFAEEKGQTLMAVSVDVTYNAAEPLAQLMLEKLIEGPAELVDADKYNLIPSIPSDTTINSVTIRDNICYVDLSREFMGMLSDVKSDVTIYSVVNTLCELSNVSKVQFSIDGELWQEYGETEHFNTPYERNLNIVTGTSSIWETP